MYKNFIAIFLISSFFQFFSSIVGFVERKFDIVTIKRRNDGTEVMISKFLLNNNDGVQISCIIWGDDIQKFDEFITNLNVSGSY